MNAIGQYLPLELHGLLPELAAGERPLCPRIESIQQQIMEATIVSIANRAWGDLGFQSAVCL